MSEYDKVLNSIKDQCLRQYATPAQEQIFEMILNKFKTQKIVNVYGSTGVGKTFLGWLLERHGYGKYCVNREELDGLQKECKWVILDNGPISREESRALRVVLLDKSIKQMVVLTNKPIDEEIPKLQLCFGTEEREKFKQNLYLICNIQVLNEEDDSNMHELIVNNL